MKKAGGFTKRMVAILLSSMLAVGTIPGTALGAEVQENTVQEEEAITTFAVTLDANGGYFVNEWDDVIGDYIESTEILNKKIHVGETVTAFPVKEQENAVVTFMGWSFERDGEIVSQGYEEYVPIETCTLYAVWNVDESAVESESSAEDTVGEDIDNQEWSQASDDSQNNHEREPEVTDNSKDDNFVNDDTSLEEKVVEEDATSLTTEQFFEFQEKVKIWKVNNQITIIYDSTEDIQLGYWVYSGITDELLYSGMIAWNEQSSLYFETVDFDVLNGEKHLEDETIDDISIKDIPIRVVLDNGISQFEENISQDTGVVTIIEEEESSDEQISLSWNPIKNVDGYLILASYSDGRVVTFETDDTTNNFSMDKTDVDYLWVTPFLFAENTRFFGDVTVYHLGKSIVSDKDEDILGNQDQLDMTQEATGENLEISEEDSQGTVGFIENEPNEKVDGKAETDEILSEGETESVSSEKLFSALNTPLDGDRYTVLLLDNSGSMSNGSRLSMAKEAAIKFCEQLIDADGVNYISIVPYASDVIRAGGFTNQLSTLQSEINQMSASGGTNINSALLMAISLLNDTPISASKNIVLLSDGIPESGATNESGRYTSSHSQKYYKYGNAVYETAKSIDQTWNIYTMGFFQSLTGSDLSFAMMLMNDIQNHGYYDVDSVDNLDFVFDTIFKDITNSISIEGPLMAEDGDDITISALYTSKEAPEIDKINWTSTPNDTLYFDNVRIDSPDITGIDNTYRISVDADICHPGKGKNAESYTSEIALNVGTIKDEKQFTITPQLVYQAEKNAFPICNSREGFGYTDDYNIPPWRITEAMRGNMGSALVTFVAQLMALDLEYVVYQATNNKESNFKGSCFGLALLSVADFEGKIDLKRDYCPGKKGSVLSKYGWNGRLEGGTGYSLTQNSELVNLIERVQCVQFSKQIRDCETFKKDEHYNKLIESIEEGDNKPYLVRIDSGHTVVIDPSKPITYCTNGVKIPVYDPNRPYAGYELSNPKSYYLQKHSDKYVYLFVNTADGTAQICEPNSKDNNIKYIPKNPTKRNNVHFYDISKLDTRVFNGATWGGGYTFGTVITSDTVTFSYGSNNIIFDSNKYISTNDDKANCGFYSYNEESSSQDNNSLAFFDIDSNNIEYKSKEAQMMIYNDHYLPYEISNKGQSSFTINFENNELYTKCIDEKSDIGIVTVIGDSVEDAFYMLLFTVYKYRLSRG